jgi:hypothetical protein
MQRLAYDFLEVRFVFPNASLISGRYLYRFVNLGDWRDLAAGNMIKDSLDDMRRDTKHRSSGGHGAAKVMQSQPIQSGVPPYLIQLFQFGLVPLANFSA